MNVRLKINLVSFVVGLIFAIGLNISGMTEPQKVLGFLDFFHQWDPSLLFVMAGAIAVNSFYFFIIKPRQRTPVFTKEFQIPTKQNLTGSLLLGSALFGIGWGLAGYCPGPALVTLGHFSLNAFVLVISIIAGMLVYSKFEKRIPLNK